MITDNWRDTFPGGKIVGEGLADLSSGRRTIPACLVSIARTRLGKAGLLASPSAHEILEPERELYRLLREAVGDAYSRYNALVRELVSFEQSLDRAGSEGNQRTTRSGFGRP